LCYGVYGSGLADGGPADGGPADGGLVDEGLADGGLLADSIVLIIGVPLKSKVRFFKERRRRDRRGTDIAENFGRLQQRQHEAYPWDCFSEEPFPQRALKDKRQGVSGESSYMSDFSCYVRPKLRGSMFQKIVGWVHNVAYLREPFYQPQADHKRRRLSSDRNCAMMYSNPNGEWSSLAALMSLLR
jgi:hypothetical protein